jgi:EpsI family protein
LGQKRPGGLQWWVAAALVLALSAPPLLASQLQAAEAAAPRLQLPDLPGTADVVGAEPLHKPVFENPSAEAIRVYGQGEAAITVHVAYYRQQTFGRKLVNSQNVLVTSEDPAWRQTARGATTVPVNGAPQPLRTAELRSGSVAGLSAGQALQVRQLYWVNGRYTTSNHLAALLGVAGQLSAQGDDAAGLTFYIAGSGPEAEAALDQFIATQLSPLSVWLNGVRAQR